MGKLGVNEMTQFAEKRVQKERELKRLTSQEFDVTNQEHIETLKKYIDNFEFSTHLMRVFQAMNEGLTISSGSWFLGYLLPIPEFINMALTTVMYVGVAGYILERFSMTDYFEELEQMQTLYNWSFKNSKTVYAPEIDNSDALAHPELQRFIKLIAPVSTTEFMITWSKLTEKDQQEPTGWAKVATIGVAALSSTASFFLSTTKKPTPENHNKVESLKKAVETREFDVGVYVGFQDALRYFATSEAFKIMLNIKLASVFNDVKSAVPSSLPAFASSSN